jgi:hypothetical protein
MKQKSDMGALLARWTFEFINEFKRLSCIAKHDVLSKAVEPHQNQMKISNTREIGKRGKILIM